MKTITFLDFEVNPETQKILDIGAIKSDESTFHKNLPLQFQQFLADSDFICGHNIISHDLKYLRTTSGSDWIGLNKAIDTLYLSPLLFPKNPYHKLTKDDKLQPAERNNPLNDAFEG